MSGTLVLLSFCCLSISCQGLQQNVEIDVAQIRDELRRQGEITDGLLKLVQDQQERIQLLTDHVTQQDKIMESQAKRVADLENKNAVLEEILSLIHNQNSSAEMLRSGKDIDSDVSRETNEEMTAGMLRSRSRKRAAQIAIAFQAVVSAQDVTDISIDGKIIFDTEHLNIGGGYHSQHGLFVAPKAGIYIFSVTILTKAYIEISIMKNGAQMGKTYCNAESSAFDEGSVTVVIQLAMGDEVYVENSWPDNASLHGDAHSNFMGCLIMEL